MKTFHLYIKVNALKITRILTLNFRILPVEVNLKNSPIKWIYFTIIRFLIGFYFLCVIHESINKPCRILGL